MMQTRDTIIKFINEYLSVTDFEDYCINGLQIEGKESIRKIILGVSSSARLFSEAVERSGDMIIVHHGLFWQNDIRPYSIVGILRNRIAMLIKNDINLAAYHLPLDAHPEIGNNAQILKMLNLNIVESAPFSCLGENSTPCDLTEFVQRVDEKLCTSSLFFHFNRKKVKKVCVISGAGISEYTTALDYGADTFITGEVKESSVRLMEEAGLNMIVAGHYNTEKLGLQALGRLLNKEFGIVCEFVDIPNPI